MKPTLLIESESNNVVKQVGSRDAEFSMFNLQCRTDCQMFCSECMLCNVSKDDYKHFYRIIMTCTLYLQHVQCRVQLNIVN